IGPEDQPDFVNAVAEISTSLSPTDLLSALQKMEHQQGRVRTEHWGPRTLDLDILLYGDQTIALPDLTVPHPEMLKRAFVLTPLLDLAPDLLLSGHDADYWLDRLPEQEIYIL
ncbi:MAG: 2-amino-4-hydroxy-6-hydroxymethyldihydropteridine diphosphokinase, partial [Natronospirillum sp.]